MPDYPRFIPSTIAVGFAWTEISASLVMVPNTKYRIVALNKILLSLPAICPLDAEFEIDDENGNGFSILQQTGQQIRTTTIADDTTIGTAGSITTRNDGFQRAYCRLICVTANTTFRLINDNGEFARV